MNIREVGSFAIAMMAMSAMAPAGATAATLGDDFNDAVKDTALWDADLILNGAVLTETGGHVAYTAGAATGIGEEGQILHLPSSAARPWLAMLPVDAAWTLEVDVHVGLPEVTGGFEAGSVAVGLWVQPQLLGGPSPFAAPVGVSLNATHDLVETSGQAFVVHDGQSPFTSGGAATTLTDVRLRLTYEPSATGLLTSSYAEIGSDVFTTLGSTVVSEEGGGLDGFIIGIAGWSAGANVQVGDGSLDNFNVSVVPEPATLMVLGLIGCAAIGRRR